MTFYMFLLLSGSIANKVFHEVLLDTCLDLTCDCWPQDSGKKRKKEGLKSSQAEGKRSKPQQDTPQVQFHIRNHSTHMALIRYDSSKLLQFHSLTFHLGPLSRMIFFSFSTSSSSNYCYFCSVKYQKKILMVWHEMKITVNEPP